MKDHKDHQDVPSENRGQEDHPGSQGILGNLEFQGCQAGQEKLEKQGGLERK